MMKISLIVDSFYGDNTVISDCYVNLIGTHYIPRGEAERHSGPTERQILGVKARILKAIRRVQ